MRIGRLQFYRNTYISEVKWKFGRMDRLRLIWLGPLFILVVPKDIQKRVEQDHRNKGVS